MRGLRKNASLERVARFAANRARRVDKRYIELAKKLHELRMGGMVEGYWEKKSHLDTETFHLSEKRFDLVEIASHLARHAGIADLSTMALWKADVEKRKENEAKAIEKGVTT